MHMVVVEPLPWKGHFGCDQLTPGPGSFFFFLVYCPLGRRPMMDITYSIYYSFRHMFMLVTGLINGAQDLTSARLL